MTLVRRSDWRSQLSACVVKALKQPFEWGRHDCALFAANAILAMTGEDLARGYRGRYRTAAGAARTLQKEGFGSSEALAEQLFDEIAPVLAVDGDICLVDGPEGPTLGIVLGEVIAAPGPESLRFLPRQSAVRAFHLPFEGEDR